MSQAFLLLLLLCLPVFTQTGKVVGVTDGDTITVQSNRQSTKVRLAGIDAPEKGQEYAEAAKRYLSTLIFDQTVTLEGSKGDRYGRLVAKVTLNGRDINLLMIQNGLAWHFKQYSNEQSTSDRKLYADGETHARRDSLNLWRYPNPVAPWDFRDRTGSSRRSSSVVRPLVSRPNYQSNSAQIIGNKNSMIYHNPGCRDHSKVSEKNRIFFKTSTDAERAGFRRARSC